MGEPTEPAPQYGRCPECGGRANFICRCELEDSICERGHSWYYCPSCKAPRMGVVSHSPHPSVYTCLACLNQQKGEP
jgi:hypothetical protein